MPLDIRLELHDVPPSKLAEIKATNDSFDGDNKYLASGFCKVIEILVDDIYVRFGGQIFW